MYQVFTFGKPRPLDKPNIVVPLSVSFSGPKVSMISSKYIIFIGNWCLSLQSENAIFRDNQFIETKFQVQL